MRASATSRRPRGLAPLAALASLLVLAACGTWFGKPDAPPLPGERLSILLDRPDLAVDASLHGQPIVLPRPVQNSDWPQADGFPSGAMHHLWIDDLPQQAWRANVGRSASRSQPRLAPPVVAGGRVFAMDADHRVSAFEADSGRQVWQTSLAPRGERGHIAGGIAVDQGRVFATTGFAAVVALDAGTGEELWRSRLNAPMRAPPTARDGRVFAITVNNTLYALGAADGGVLWTHQAIEEVASLVGGAGPVVDAGVVVAPFTSGEVVALRVENGLVLWADSFGPLRRIDELGSIAHVRAAPVMDRGLVFAISYAGVMAAIDLRTGQRIWDEAIGGLERPWVAGDQVFVLSGDRELVCLDRTTGRIRWVTALPAYEDAERRRRPIQWTGPVLVSDRLVLAGSHGQVITASPYTGELLGRIDMPDRVTVPPVVAGGTLFFLGRNAQLVAYR
ncbi:MAG: pyrrolo-quinoline quinone [Rhodospirillales bacterium]|nr:MAG: pyrrolo-quinoline quinone [Rhodospirillales bacterium]